MLPILKGGPLFAPESAVVPLPTAAPSPSTNDLIDGRIEVHDSNHFEVKLDYAIDPKVAQNRYRVEAYFFVPRSLGITADTYSREQFYSDIQAYIRFKTPVMSLKALLDPENAASPVTRLGRTLPQLLNDPLRTDLQSAASQDLRLSGCLVRAHVRDQVATLCKLIAPLGRTVSANAQAITDVRGIASRLLTDLDEVVKHHRDLRPQLLDSGVPRWIRETHEYVDEYLSITAEVFLTKFVQVLDEHPTSRAHLLDVRQAFLDRVLAEREHRRNCGWPSIPEAGGEASFVYRRGLLKKFVTSVLFLEFSKGKEGRRIIDLAAALAAGVAMLVASVGSLWVQKRYVPTAWPFIVTIVLLYMVKDRLKDWLKQYFASTMTRFLADYSVRIHDPLHGVDIGRCREAFSFIRAEQVPSDVWALRHGDAKTLIESSSKPEVVMKYEKAVTLRGDVINQLNGLHHEINDILRFDVSQFLVRTDDPTTQVAFYRPGTDRVEHVDCPKVYHLNLVFVLTVQDRPCAPTLERVRVVLDKRGIRRLEQV